MTKEQCVENMFVTHITNPEVLMIVIGTNPGSDVTSCILCEWVGKNGNFNREYLRPVHLKEYVPHLAQLTNL